MRPVGQISKTSNQLPTYKRTDGRNVINQLIVQLSSLKYVQTTRNKLSCIHSLEIYSVPKKQPLCFLVITSANINRFSKFFHRLIPKKTVRVAMIAVPPHLDYVATLPCEIRNFTITAKLSLVQEKLMFYMKLSKVNKVQNMLISMWTNEVMFRVNVQNVLRRLRRRLSVTYAIHWSRCQSLPGSDGPIPPIT